MKKTIIFSLAIFSLFIFSACSVEKSQEDDFNSMGIFPENYQNLYSQGYNHALIKTNLGDIKVKLYGDKSPDTVNNFLNLANLGFYEDIKFHRVINDFMIQVGCPHSKTENERLYGTGDPGYKFPDEINDVPLVKGSLAMANSGPNTNGSQFFIVTAASTPWLDGAHTNFGEVVEGMEVVEEIENSQTAINDLPVNDIVIKEVQILKD